MSTWTHLLHYLERVIHRDRRLHCEAVARDAPLPLWLATPWADAQRNADAAMPTVVINVKGARPGDCLAVMRLADLETLVESLNALEKLTDPTTADLVADPETREAAIVDFLGA